MTQSKILESNKKIFIPTFHYKNSYSEKNLLFRPSIHLLKKLDNFKILNPIEIKISKEGKEFLSEIQELDIYSYDSILINSINEVKHLLAYTYNSVFNIEKSRLGKNPLSWKKFLSEHLQKNE